MTQSLFMMHAFGKSIYFIIKCKISKIGDDLVCLQEKFLWM